MVRAQSAAATGVQHRGNTLWQWHSVVNRAASKAADYGGRRRGRGARNIACAPGGKNSSASRLFAPGGRALNAPRLRRRLGQPFSLRAQFIQIDSNAVTDQPLGFLMGIGHNAQAGQTRRIGSPVRFVPLQNRDIFFYSGSSACFTTFWEVPANISLLGLITSLAFRQRLIMAYP